jgi:thiaminase
MELVDKKTVDLSQDKKETLCKVFKTCAEFENRFWDAL